MILRIDPLQGGQQLIHIELDGVIPRYIRGIDIVETQVVAENFDYGVFIRGFGAGHAVTAYFEKNLSFPQFKGLWMIYGDSIFILIFVIHRESPLGGAVDFFQKFRTGPISPNKTPATIGTNGFGSRQN